MASAADGDANLTGETPILEILSGAPHFKSPSQVRSHEKTAAILEAADALLRERHYASIRMQDVAYKAGCAVTAIYARFADKDGLLTPPYARLRMRSCTVRAGSSPSDFAHADPGSGMRDDVLTRRLRHDR